MAEILGWCCTAVVGKGALLSDIMLVDADIVGGHQKPQDNTHTFVVVPHLE